MPPAAAISARRKTDLTNTVIKLLEERFGDEIPAARVRQHLNYLPTKYAQAMLDGNCESLLLHEKLLNEARERKKSKKQGCLAPVFNVRPVEVNAGEEDATLSPNGTEGGDEPSSVPSSLPMPIRRPSAPSFGSSPNLVMLAAMELSAEENANPGSADSNGHDSLSSQLSQTDLVFNSMMHEVTFAGANRPSVLNLLTTSLSDLGLSVLEAHAFTTTDGLLLDTFVVSGWKMDDLDTFRELLEDAVATNQQRFETSAPSRPTSATGWATPSLTPRSPSPVYADWEIDHDQLDLGRKVAEGSFGDLYRGTYCGQTVAIKLLKPEKAGQTVDVEAEFSHEVAIMRKVRHKNVVQFIGVGSTAPNLYIVTEFMEGGCLHDHLKKNKATAGTLEFILRVALDVARGMDYLHKNGIIHRDLKATNLLMDEHGTVKVSDFGVSRFISTNSVMTAETGTYRWMAPEVIEHRPYDRKADVFSYGIFLWELVSGEVPYAGLTPLQAAVGVAQQRLRPKITSSCPPSLSTMMRACWEQDPEARPDFNFVVSELEALEKQMKAASNSKANKESGFFRSFTRSMSKPKK